MTHKNYLTPFNIYYGTIGKTLGVKYRFTRDFPNDKEAIKFAEKTASAFYYKNEGKYGIPSYSQIEKEHEIIGVDIEDLYKEHMKDMIRYYAIPTELDTISNSKLKY